MYIVEDKLIGRSEADDNAAVAVVLQASRR